MHTRTKMRFLGIIIFIFMCVLFTAMASEAFLGKIESLSGTVYLQHHGQTQPSIAQVKDEIFDKDKIRTDSHSKANIRFINKASIDIGPNTDLEIKELYYHHLGLSKFSAKMELGRLKIFVSKFTNPHSRFEIHTTTSVINIMNNSQFGKEGIIINKQDEDKELTHVICTLDRFEVRNIDPNISDKIILEPFQQAWVFEGEAPKLVQDISMEEVKEILAESIVLSKEKVAVIEPGEKDTQVKSEEKGGLNEVMVNEKEAIEDIKVPQEGGIEVKKMQRIEKKEEMLAKEEEVVEKTPQKMISEETPLEPTDNQLYRIGPEDILEISVWRDENLAKQVVVRPDGMVSFPLIGDVQASGKTQEELCEAVTEKLKRFIPDPVVTVAILKTSSKIYVIGNVAHPGEFILGSRINVLQALSMAGGLNPFASSKKISIIRIKDNKQMTIPFNYKDVIQGKHLDQNIFLQRGDVIVVP